MLQTQCLHYSYWPSLHVSSWPIMAKHVTPLFTDLGVHGNTKGKCVLRILSPPGKCASQILVLDASCVKLHGVPCQSFVLFSNLLITE